MSLEITENGKFNNINLGDLDGLTKESVVLIKGKYDPREVDTKNGKSWSVSAKYKNKFVGFFVNSEELVDKIKEVPEGEKFAIQVEIKEIKTEKGKRYIRNYIFSRDVEEHEKAQETQVVNTEDKRYLVAVSYLQGEVEKETKIDVNGEEFLVKNYIPEIIELK